MALLACPGCQSSPELGASCISVDWMATQLGFSLWLCLDVQDFNVLWRSSALAVFPCTDRPRSGCPIEEIECFRLQLLFRVPRVTELNGIQVQTVQGVVQSAHVLIECRWWRKSVSRRPTLKTPSTHNITTRGGMIHRTWIRRCLVVAASRLKCLPHEPVVFGQQNGSIYIL